MCTWVRFFFIHLNVAPLPALQFFEHVDCMCITHIKWMLKNRAEKSITAQIVVTYIQKHQIWSYTVLSVVRYICWNVFFLPFFCCSIFLHFSSSFRYWFRFGCECVGVYLCIIHQPNEALKKYTEWRVNAEKSAWKPMACGAESWDSLSHLENRSWHKICWCGIFMPFKSFSLSHSLWLRTSSPPSLCDSVSLCGKNCIIVRLLNCLRPNERLPSEYRERWESECERIWYGAVLCCCVPNRQFVFSDSLLIHTLNAVGFLLAFGSFGLAFGSLFGRGSGRWLVCMC